MKLFISKVFEDLNEKENEDEEKGQDVAAGAKDCKTQSMPVISNILISIDETDAEGNIINSRIVEAQETMELPPTDGPLLILT